MIAKKSFLIVSTHFFICFLGWIGVLVLAKLWGNFAPSALGVIGFAMSFLSLFQIISDLGFSHAHVKRVSEGKDLGTCIGTFATIKILLTSIMVLVIFISIYLLKNVFHSGFYDATTESVIYVLILYSIFTSLSGIAIKTFVGKREIAKLQIANMFENIIHVPLSIIVALAGVNVMGWAISPAVVWPEFLQPLQRFLSEHATGSLAITYVFGIMGTFLVGIWLMRNNPIKKPNKIFAKNYSVYALPIMLSSIIAIISTNIDKLTIGFFWTSVEVGYYFTVQRVLTFMIILSTAVSTVIFPSISSYHAEKNFKKIKETTLLAERYISMVLIPPVIFIIVMVVPTIKIMLDEAFVPAAPVLIVLAIWAFIYGISTPYSNLIGGIDKPDILAKISALTCTTNIVLNFLIVPKNGILSSVGINGPTGAALATVIAFFISYVGYRFMSKKLLNITILQSHTIRHIFAGLVMGGILYLLIYQTSLFSIVRWYTLLFFAIFGLVIYLAILFLLKEFKKQDLIFFLDLLNPKGMFRYVKSELKDNKKKK
jgi:O-antigen/teichoic acid export membrane protein